MSGIRVLPSRKYVWSLRLWPLRTTVFWNRYSYWGRPNKTWKCRGFGRLMLWW